MSSLNISDMVEWVNAITGWDVAIEEFLRVGERSINLKRMLNLSCGLKPEADTVPIRLLQEAFPDGGAANHLPDLWTRLKEYYSVRGWNDQGVPTKEKLVELGLDKL